MSARGVRFVVLSSAKSGSTWISRMISACPGLHCGESAPFGRYSNESNPTGARTTLDEAAFRALGYTMHGDEQQREAQPLAFELWDAVARYWRARTGAAVYGEKLTPHTGAAERAIRSLAAYDPSIRLVRLVRDGRDVVVSGAAHQLNIAASRPADRPSPWASPAEAERHLESRTIPAPLFEVLVRNWAEANRAMLDHAPLFGRSLEARYERLIEDPEAARALLRFVAGDEVRLSEGEIAAAIESASFASLSGGRAAGDEDRRSFFRKGVAGDWTNWFTPDQADRFDCLAGDEMRALGYPARASGAMAC